MDNESIESSRKKLDRMKEEIIKANLKCTHGRWDDPGSSNTNDKAFNIFILVISSFAIFGILIGGYFIDAAFGCN